VYQLVALGVLVLSGVLAVIGFVALVSQPLLIGPPFRVVVREDSIKQFAAAIRERFRINTEVTLHADTMLTWAIGLMGAGVFGSKDFLANAPIALRFAAVLPWMAGILFAVVSRVLASEMIHRASFAHYSYVGDVESVLFLDQAAAQERLGALLAGDEKTKKQNEEMIWWARVTNDFFYGAHVLLGFGIVAVLVVAYSAGR
jgi:hypothetical protein